MKPPRWRFRAICWMDGWLAGLLLASPVEAYWMMGLWGTDLFKRTRNGNCKHQLGIYEVHIDLPSRSNKSVSANP